MLVELVGKLGRRRRAEAGAAATPTVSEQGELRDDQDLAGDFCNRAIHLAGFVLENSQAGGFLGEVGGIDFVVLSADPKQHQQALLDGSDDLSFNTNLGLG